MTVRKLTTEQIEELFEFCDFHSVIYYDVQVEIVDHLASAIEDLWETDPEMPFEEAVHALGEQFGGSYGFTIIKEEKEKALRKKYRRLLWQYICDFYKFPKIMITLMLTLSLYTALRFSENDQWIFILLLVFFIASSMLYNFNYQRNHLLLKIKDGYTFLLNEISLRGFLNYTGVICLSSTFSSAIKEAHISTFGNIIFSIFVPFYMVMLYGNFFFIRKKIREHFEEQFPQFVKS